MSQNDGQQNVFSGKFIHGNASQKNSENSFTINIHNSDKQITQGKGQDSLAAQIFKYLILAGICLVIVSLVASKFFGYDVTSYIKSAWDFVSPSIAMIVGYSVGMKK